MNVWYLIPLFILMIHAPVAASSASRPSVGHGLGRIIGGLIFEFPRTVLEATLEGPPVVGTAVGLLAGTARASQAVVGGVMEMAAGFDPWSTK